LAEFSDVEHFQVDRRRPKDEGGAALVEYALLIGFIAVVCIIATTQLGLAVSAKLNMACVSLGGTHC
jgi:Flp pilus assembly pilin Flp